jgi:hypothetical protein
MQMRLLNSRPGIGGRGVPAKLTGLSTQRSHGRLDRPELPEPAVSVERTTASVRMTIPAVVKSRLTFQRWEGLQ